MAPPSKIVTPNLLIDTVLADLGLDSNYKLAKLLGVGETQICTTRRTGKAPPNLFFGICRLTKHSLHHLRTLEGTVGAEHKFVPLNTPTDILWKAIMSKDDKEIAALIGPKPKGL